MSQQFHFHFIGVYSRALGSGSQDGAMNMAARRNVFGKFQKARTAIN